MILLLTLAWAGKLDDGWRGIPYGLATNVATKPTAECKATPEEEVLWGCKEEVAGIPVEVAYMGAEGWYTGVIISAHGYTNCSTLFSTLKAAWNVPFTEKKYASGLLPDGFWNLMVHETTTSGAWNYNEYSGNCSAFTVNTELSERIEAKKAERARAAAEAL
jgi:hypothetical protein